ncbi:MAG TPA: hypothetical protein VFC65_08180 [Prolixibacteraceae bacterium]|nr:hypothetical protein [Prolixibacteraceae bacterium]
MKTYQILIFLLAILFVSCTESSIEDFVVGENFIKNKTGIVMVDTLTISSSLVKYDSIASNSSDRFLLGSNYNSVSGYKNSNMFLEMTFDDDISYTEFVFDSLCLVMDYDTYSFGDTTVTQTFSVHQLKKEMELDDDNYLYTTSQFAYEETPLGTISLKPKPNSHKKVSIRLSDKFGNRLSEMIRLKRDTITSSVLFNTFFKGLVVKSQSDIKGAAVGFYTTDTESTTSTTSSSDITKPEIRLYYHLKPNPENLSDLYYKFSFNSDGIYFNQISSDESNSLIDGISDTDNERSSKLTNNYLFVQSGIQIFSKIKIPYLENLLLTAENSAFIAATLRLYPVKGTYTNTDDLPTSLYVYSADRKNVISGQFYLPGSTSDYAYAQLTIVTDVEETVYYEVDITTFLNTELNEELLTDRSIMIGYGTTDAKTTIDHVIFGGPNSGKFAPELNVYYFHN